MLIGLFHELRSEDAIPTSLYVDAGGGCKTPRRRKGGVTRVRKVQILGGGKAGGDAVPDPIVSPATRNKIKTKG